MMRHSGGIPVMLGNAGKIYVIMNIAIYVDYTGVQIVFFYSWLITLSRYSGIW